MEGFIRNRSSSIKKLKVIAFGFLVILVASVCSNVALATVTYAEEPSAPANVTLDVHNDTDLDLGLMDVPTRNPRILGSVAVFVAGLLVGYIVDGIIIYATGVSVGQHIANIMNSARNWYNANRFSSSYRVASTTQQVEHLVEGVEVFNLSFCSITKKNRVMEFPLHDFL